MKLSTCIALCAGWLTASSLSAAVIPITSGTAAGSPGGGGFFTGATDAQPATPPTAGDDPTYAGGAGMNFAGTDTRAAYIDFGVDYANVAIDEVLLLLKLFGSDPHSQDNYWWSPSNDASFVVADGDVAAPDFNILDVPGDPDSDQQWVSVWSSAVPLTPANRYLIVQRVANASNVTGNRSLEVVFLGTVPEPGAAVLFIVGGAGLLLRRRRRA